MIKLKDLLETIKAEEAHRDANAVQTVVDGKRDLGYITIKGSTLDEKDFWDMVKQGGLKTIKVPENPYEAYIYFRPGADQKANELKTIAMNKSNL